MLVWDERDVYKERLPMPTAYCCSQLEKVIQNAKVSILHHKKKENAKTTN
jgi:hypothetical protein